MHERVTSKALEMGLTRERDSSPVTLQAGFRLRYHTRGGLLSMKNEYGETVLWYNGDDKYAVGNFPSLELVQKYLGKVAEHFGLTVAHLVRESGREIWVFELRPA